MCVWGHKYKIGAWQVFCVDLRFPNIFFLVTQKLSQAIFFYLNRKKKHLEKSKYFKNGYFFQKFWQRQSLWIAAGHIWWFSHRNQFINEVFYWSTILNIVDQMAIIVKHARLILLNRITHCQYWAHCHTIFKLRFQDCNIFFNVSKWMQSFFKTKLNIYFIKHHLYMQFLQSFCSIVT